MNFEKEFNALKKRLDEAIKNNLADIEESQAELDEVIHVLNKYGDQELVRIIAQDAINYARDIISDGEKLIKAQRLLSKI